MPGRFYKFLIAAFLLLQVSGACKEAISPNDKFAGVYDYFTSGIPGPDKNWNYPGGQGRVSIRKVSNTQLSFTLYEAQQTEGNASFVFPVCEIVKIDTTGNKYQPYARIINRENNIEIAQIRDWYERSAIPTREVVMLNVNFPVAGNPAMKVYAMKRYR